ncbi:NERD domain-containing protein [Arthrobacter sp. NPDC056727]|uniref:NERD domain-containing protein n=1 Tax=Arthrobacter sp. NPDC056727 TaxID=3345927 RepID=UPI003671F1C5
MGAGDAAFERTRLASERIARLKRDLAPSDSGTQGGCGPAGPDHFGAGSVRMEQTSHLVAEKLAQLGAYGWFLLHDVHWPGRPLARLEHVLVGPGGVVVVNAKSWSGDVGVVDGSLRQNGHDRFPAVETALAQAAAVAAVLPAQRRRLVRSLICLTGQPELQGTTGAGIEVRGIGCIAAAVAGLPDELDAPAVLLLYAQLGQLLTRPQVADQGAVRNLGYRPAAGGAGAGRPGPGGAGADVRRPVHRRPVPPRYLYGRDQRTGSVLRVVGRSVVAGLVSAALLAPPLWLLWELLPK